MVETIFSKIIRKEIPSFVIKENDDFISFLDVNPIVKGHTLVIPKNFTENLFTIAPDDLSKFIIFTKETAELLKTKLGATGVNILHASGKSAQQSVFHFHFHLVPRFDNDGINTWPDLKYTENKLEEVYKEITLD